MDVTFKTPGGATRSNFDTLRGIRYASVTDGPKTTAVLVKGIDDFRCSRCTHSGCEHEKAAADMAEITLNAPSPQ